MTREDANLIKEQTKAIEVQKERILRAASRWAEAEVLGAFLQDNGLTWNTCNEMDKKARVEQLLYTLQEESKTIVKMRALFSRTMERGVLQW